MQQKVTDEQAVIPPLLESDCLFVGRAADGQWDNAARLAYGTRTGTSYVTSQLPAGFLEMKTGAQKALRAGGASEANVDEALFNLMSLLMK